MSGGFSDYSHEIDQPERLPEIQAAIHEINADVIGLVDTFRWDDMFSEQQLCDMFGYQYARSINLNDPRLGASGHNNGLTILSNYPWTECETVSLGSRDALKATFDLGQKSLELFIAYFDDLQKNVRLAQAKKLQTYITDISKTIIIGDLNTLSLIDDTEEFARDLETFYESNPQLVTPLSPVIDQMREGQVVEYLQSLGLTDAGSGQGATAPTRLFPARYSKPFLRLDYCLYGEDVTVTDFTVHDNELMQRTSDHLPFSFSAA